jgi:hypothetical protein
MYDFYDPWQYQRPHNIRNLQRGQNNPTERHFLQCRNLQRGLNNPTEKAFFAMPVKRPEACCI